MLVQPQHRVVHQRRQKRDAVAVDDRLGRVEGEAADEHAQLRQPRLLSRFERLPASLEYLVQRAVTSFAAAPDQQTEAFAEAAAQRTDRNRPRARGGELQRQRPRVEGLHQLCDIGVVFVDRAARGSGPLYEERHRIGLGEGPCGQQLLAGDAQGHPAGDQEARGAGRGHPAPQQRRQGLGHLLGVVDDHPPGATVDEDLLDLLGGVFAQRLSEARPHRPADVIRVLRFDQIAEPY